MDLISNEVHDLVICDHDIVEDYTWCCILLWMRVCYFGDGCLASGGECDFTSAVVRYRSSTIGRPYGICQPDVDVE